MKKRIKRVTAAVLTAAMTLAFSAAVFREEAAAEEVMDFETARQASYDTVPESNGIEGWPQGPQIYGNSGIVMEDVYKRQGDARCGGNL